MEITRGKIGWVDIVKPTSNDLSWLKKEYHLHPTIIEELRAPSARAKAETHKNYCHLIYYFPIYDQKEMVSKRGEIDFIITKKEVITVAYEEIEAFINLKNKINPLSHFFGNTTLLTHKLIEILLMFQNRQLIHIGEKINGVSEELFKEREKERERQLLEKICYLKRDISQYRIIVKPQKHILESLLENSDSIFGEEAKTYINDLINEQMKILDQLEDYRQAVEDFETTNNQLIGIKNAQVVRTFTILAFLTFPMMLFAALFSMNTRDTPIVNHAQAFWIIIGIMFIAMSGMFVYFKKRDWL